MALEQRKGAAAKTPKLPRVKDRRGGASLVSLMDRIQAGAPERRQFKDRRATPRAAVAFQVEATNGRRTVMMQAVNLSSFGVATAPGPVFKVRSRLSVRLFLPDEGPPLDVEVEVLGTTGAAGGTRMKFLDPPLHAVRRIHRLVA
jgi:hypothetical protein